MSSRSSGLVVVAGALLGGVLAAGVHAAPGRSPVGGTQSGLPEGDGSKGGVSEDRTCRHEVLLIRLADLESAADGRRWSEFGSLGKLVAAVDWTPVDLEVVPLERRAALAGIAEEAGFFGIAAALARDVASHRRRLYEEACSASRSREFTESLVDVGFLELTLGDPEAAQGSLQEGLTLARRASAEDGLPEDLANLANCLDGRGGVEHLRGNADAARDLHEESLGIRRPLGEIATSDENRRLLARSLRRLAWLALEDGKAGEARGPVDDSLAIWRSLASGGSPRDLRGLAYALEQLAAVSDELGERDSADAAIGEGLEIARRLVVESATPRSNTVLADLEMRWASFAWDRGDLAAAQERYRDSVANYRRAVTQEDSRSNRRDLASALRNLAEIDRARGDLGSALGHARESLVIRRATQEPNAIPADLQELCESLETAARVELGMEDAREALTLAMESLAIRRRLAWEMGADPGGRKLLGTLDLARAAEAARGDYAAASSLARELVEIARSLLRSDESIARRKSLGNALWALGSAEVAERDFDRGLSHLREAEAILQAVADESRTPESREAVERCAAAISRAGWASWFAPFF